MELNSIWKQLAEDHKPSSTADIIPLIYYLARFTGAKHTVEIGIGWGYGAAGLGCLAKEQEGSHTVIDVAVTPIARAHKIKAMYDLPLEVIHASSNDLVWDKPIDLLFIDGDHTYEYVKRDIEIYIPHVRKNKLIIFHDYYSRPGTRQAIDELFDPALYEQIHLPFQTAGLVIWRKL